MLLPTILIPYILMVIDMNWSSWWSMLGQGELDFVHLGSPRLVATYNPCHWDWCHVSISARNSGHHFPNWKTVLQHGSVFLHRLSLTFVPWNIFNGVAASLWAQFVLGQDDIYHRAFGRPSEHRLFTYCCDLAGPFLLIPYIKFTCQEHRCHVLLYNHVYIIII